MPRVTIKDIARISGYSKTSVSFAFNDPGRISEQARTKILTVAKSLGYIPDPLARSLSLRHHGSIGLLLPEVIPLAFLNSHLSEIVRGIGDICESHGHSLTLIPPLRESVLEGVRSAAVDGLITIGLEPGMETVSLIRHRHLPFVTIDGRVGGGFPVVGIDDRTAAREAMEYILGLGHRDVAVITFSDEPQIESRSHVKQQRMEGYREAYESRGRSFSSEVRYMETEPTMSAGREAAEKLFSLLQPPTAMVVMSDVIAIGVMDYLEQAGVPIPGEVSVIGFDDIPEARLVRPQLTTTAQPGFEKGRRAAEILMQMIAGQSVASEYRLDTHLVERDSCGPPPSVRVT
jgi:DNA-binding LacI/PurR family transcriptional regulator